MTDISPQPSLKPAATAADKPRGYRPCPVTRHEPENTRPFFDPNKHPKKTSALRRLWNRFLYWVKPFEKSRQIDQQLEKALETLVEKPVVINKQGYYVIGDTPYRVKIASRNFTTRHSTGCITYFDMERADERVRITYSLKGFSLTYEDKITGQKYQSEAQEATGKASLLLSNLLGAHSSLVERSVQSRRDAFQQAADETELPEI